MIVSCRKHDLQQRCLQRGYTLQEVLPCVVAETADEWIVDTLHPAYPRHHKETIVAAKDGNDSSGPGAELSKLLKRFGINPTPTCKCRAKAAEMDAWGPDECERPERIEEVVAVMREEARARGLPFLDAAGRMLIRRAIANARRAAS